MIYDIIITSTFKNGQKSTDKSSIEAPNLLAAVVFAIDFEGDANYKPSPSGDDEGNITVSAKAAANNTPTYELRKATIKTEDGSTRVTAERSNSGWTRSTTTKKPSRAYAKRKPLLEIQRASPPVLQWRDFATGLGGRS